MKRNIILCCFFWMVSTTVKAQSLTEKLTLKACIEIATKNNLDVYNSNVLSQTADINLQQAKGNRLPDINGNVYHGANQGRSIDPFTNSYINQNVSTGNYSLTASLTLFNGFAIQNNIKQQKLSAEAASLEEQQTKDNLTLNVILAYLQVLTARDLLVQAAQQKAVTTNQVQRLEILHNDGAITPSLLYDLRGQLAADEVNEINAQNTLAQAKFSLVGLMNISYSTDIDVEPISLEALSDLSYNGADSIYKKALNNLAIIKAADLRSESALYGLKSARALQYPSLNFGGGVYTNYSSVASTLRLVNTEEVATGSYVDIDGSKFPVIARQDNFANEKITYGKQFGNNISTSIGIGLSIPLLNGLQTKTQIRNAALQQKNALFIAKSTKTALQQNVQQAYLNFTTAQNGYKALLNQVAAFKQSFEVAEIRFKEGVLNSVDFIIAKNNLDRANSNLIVAKYNFILRQKILDFYQGALTF